MSPAPDLRPDPARAAADLLGALATLPPYTGVVFHGLPDAPQLHRSRATIGLTATSLNPRIATENFATPVVAAIVSRTGRDITAYSLHPAEQEVVIPPGALLHTLAVTTCLHDSRPLLVLEQLAPLDPSVELPPTLDGLIALVRARIDEAWRAAAVSVTTPGKFVEPLFFEGRSP